MSKFSTKPSKYYYELVKGIAKYLHKSKDWGIKFTRSVVQNDLVPATLKSDVVPDESLPAFNVDINQPRLMACFDAAYANDQQKQRSTTGFVFTYYCGSIVYPSKNNMLQLLVLLK